MQTTITSAHAYSNKSQPRGLYVLFFAELWERFGFYSIQALLVLFLVKHYGYTDDQAYAFLGAYSALIYASPVLGGYLADKVLGFRKAILLGALLYILGYLGLALQQPDIFYWALSLLIAGNGFFKSSVSTLLGTLYDKDDVRRDSGFTIFYMGINLGIFFAPILCTYAAEQYGWGYGFGLAAIGMIIGLINCLLKFNTLDKRGLPPREITLRPLANPFILYGIVLISIWGCSTLLHYHQLIKQGMVLFSLVVVLALIAIAIKQTKQKRNRLLALLILMVISTLFWTFYFQTYLSVTLFIERCVERHIFGWEAPTGMLSSAIGLFNIGLAPIFALLWLRYAHSRWTPSSPMKFALGIILVSLTFLVIAFGSQLAGSEKTPILWIFLGYLLTSCGELCLSPIGLSLVTALAPCNVVGMVMGIWFMTLAAGYAIAGHIAQLTSIPDTIIDLVTIKQLYASVFYQYAYIGLSIGVTLILLTPLLKKLMSESH